MFKLSLAVVAIKTLKVKSKLRQRGAKISCRDSMLGLGVENIFRLENKLKCSKIGFIFI